MAATRPQRVARNKQGKRLKKQPPPGRIEDDLNEDPVVAEEPPPPRSNASTRWIQRLTPLLKHKGVWHKIRTMESPEQASGARQSLTSRKVLIPEPNHDWSFAARGCEVFAIYRGRKVGRK